MRQERPELGTLLDVVPVVETRQHGPWTLTLVSLERWDNCLVANVNLLHAEPFDWSGGWLPPLITLGAQDDRGERYDEWPGGDYGGGLRDGGASFRTFRKFTPPPDPAVRELRFAIRLGREGPELGAMPPPPATNDNAEPWRIVVGIPLPPDAMPSSPTVDGRGAGADRRCPAASTDRSARRGAAVSVSDPSPEPPDLRLLRRVIPVVQTQEAVGWSITLIAVEAYDDGFILSFRLYGDGKPSNPDLMLSRQRRPGPHLPAVGWRGDRRADPDRLPLAAFFQLCSHVGPSEPGAGRRRRRRASD